MGVTRALITGASSGIGRELAHILAQEGIELILVARHTEHLHEFKNALVIACDLTTRDGVQKVCSEIAKSAPDLVINNAGIGLYGDFVNQELEELQEIIDLNISALVTLSWQAASVLKEKGKKGVIVNVSSVLSLFTSPGAALYAATKTFVNSFSKALDYELAPFGIRVLVSAPGQVATNFRARASKGRTNSDGIVLDAKKVAEEIWQQIQKQKSLQIIDIKYRMLLFFSKLLPSSVITKRLAATFRAR